jgi:energy-coupling factor transporter ATP-binding protein EcfA2
LLLGEAGSGKTTLAETLTTAISSLKVAFVSYDGSVTGTLEAIADQLNIDTTNDKGRPLRGDALKEAIADGMNSNTLLICDNAHRWAASLRYWLEILHGKGVILLLLAIEDLKRDIFIRLTRIELSPLKEDEIREIMIREAVAVNLSITPSKISQLIAIAGLNPLLAKQVIQEAAIGRHFEEGGKGNAYINVAPFVNGILTLLGVIRFLGLGLGDRSLYIFGGIAMILAIGVRYIGLGINQAAKRKPLGKK